ncbi:MAG: hypothetical protein KAG14_02300 [Mycoplasmataceae bacterium]|nr:hypothetical protein [Mycoplasmataceae bacterium]
MAIVLQQPNDAPSTNYQYGNSDALGIINKIIDKYSKNPDFNFPLNVNILNSLKTWFSHSSEFKSYIDGKIKESELKGFNFVEKFSEIVTVALTLKEDITFKKMASLVTTVNLKYEYTALFDDINYIGKIQNEMEKWVMPNIDISSQRIDAEFEPFIIALKEKYNIKGHNLKILKAVADVKNSKAKLIQAIKPYIFETPFRDLSTVMGELISKLKAKFIEANFVSSLNDEMIERVQRIFDNAEQSPSIISEINLLPKIFVKGKLKNTQDFLNSMNRDILKGLNIQIIPFITQPSIMSFGKVSEKHIDSPDGSQVTYTFSIPVVMDGILTSKSITRDITVDKYNVKKDFENIVNNKELIHLGKYFILPEEVLSKDETTLDLNGLIDALSHGIEKLITPEFHIPSNEDSSTEIVKNWNENIERMIWFKEQLQAFKVRYPTVGMTVTLKYSLDISKELATSVNFGSKVIQQSRENYLERMIEFTNFELIDSQVVGYTFGVHLDNPFIQRTYSWLSNILKKMQTILYTQNKNHESMLALKYMTDKGYITTEELRQILSPALREQLDLIIAHNPNAIFKIDNVPLTDRKQLFKISFEDINGWQGNYGAPNTYKTLFLFEAKINDSSSWIKYISKKLIDANPYPLFEQDDKTINSKELYEWMSKTSHPNLPKDMIDKLFFITGTTYTSLIGQIKSLVITRNIDITPQGTKIMPLGSRDPNDGHILSETTYYQKYQLTNKITGETVTVWVNVMKVLSSIEVANGLKKLEHLYQEYIKQIHKYILEPSKQDELQKKIDIFHKYSIDEMNKPYISLPKENQLLEDFKAMAIDLEVPTNSVVENLKTLLLKEKPFDAKKLLKIGASLKREDLKIIMDKYEGNPEGLFKLLRNKKLIEMLKDGKISVAKMLNAAKSISDTIKYTLLGVASTLGLGSLTIWATGASAARTNKRLIKNNKKYKYKSTKGMVITSALLGLLSMAGSIGMMIYVFIIKGGL